MLSDENRRTIHETLTRLKSPAALILNESEDRQELLSDLEELAAELHAASGGQLSVRREKTAKLPAGPGLTIDINGNENIHYLALPVGPELAPLLDTLTLHRADQVDRISEINRPAEIMVFIAADCPHCPQAVATANQIALATNHVSVIIVDAQRFPELAVQHGIQSVPATILDGELVLIGVQPAATIIDNILARGRDEYEARILQSLLEGGRAREAAGRLLRKNSARSLPILWQDSALSTRMGLMLASETALRQDPATLDHIAPSLLPFLENEDPAVRGDTADLLGKIGHSLATEALTKLLNDNDPDVIEVAQEALQAIQDRGA